MIVSVKASGIHCYVLYPGSVTLHVAMSETFSGEVHRTRRHPLSDMYIYMMPLWRENDQGHATEPVGQSAPDQQLTREPVFLCNAQLNGNNSAVKVVMSRNWCSI